MDKVQIKGYISSYLNDKFRTFIAQKSGKYNGRNISKYLERAIDTFLELQQGQNTNTHNTKIVQKTEKVNLKVNNEWKKVIDYLVLQSGLYSSIERGQRIPEDHLRRAISQVSGADRRTIDNWILKFLDNKIIAKSGIHLYEVLYSGDFESSPPIIKERQ